MFYVAIPCKARKSGMKRAVLKMRPEHVKQLSCFHILGNAPHSRSALSRLEARFKCFETSAELILSRMRSFCESRCSLSPGNGALFLCAIGD